jgi:PAS domain S-box-containing protein
VESTDDAIISKSTDGTIQSWNRGAERLYGYAAAEVVGKPITVIVPPDRLDEVEEINAALARGEARRDFETVRVRKDGRRIHVSLTVAPLRDAAGRIVGGCRVERDITARKAAEAALEQAKAELELRVQERTAALRASEERLALALRAGRSGTFDWDATQDRNHWSDELLALYGLTRGEFGGRAEDWLACLVPEDRSAGAAAVQQALESGIFSLEFRIRRRDTGEVRWMHGHAQVFFDPAQRPSRMIGINVDITERKRAEAALHASERRERERARDLEALLDAVPTPVFIVHDPDSVHITGNRAADELLRNPRGAEASLTAPSDARPRHFKAIQDGRELASDDLPAQRAARGIPVRDFEFTLAFDDGTSRDVVGYGSPLWDEEGRPRGAVHVLVDITDRKRAEAEVRSVALFPEQNPYPILRIAGDCTLLYANRGAAPLLERWGAAVAQRLDARECDTLLAPLQTGATSEVSVEWEGRVYSLVCVPVMEAGYVNVFGRDITERQRGEAQLRLALAEKDAALATNQTLLREVHHRVKNNLQMVCDLLYLQMEAMPDPDQHHDLQDAYGRIFAIARLHEQLYQTMRGGEVRLGEYLRRLAAGFGTLYPHVAVRLEAEEPLYLDLDRAIHAGLIVNELVTNAVKHAFPDGRRGEVRVRVGTEGDRAVLQVADAGTGLPAGFDLDTAKSLGLRIVQILARRLQASLEVANTKGATFRVTFPMHAEAPVDAGRQ